MTSTGKRSEMLKDVPPSRAATRNDPAPVVEADVREGHLAILEGKPRARGCVAQDHRAQEPGDHRPARVFDSENDCMQAIMAKESGGDVT